VWHQLSKDLRLGNVAPGIHDYDEQSDISKKKGKSLPDTEDDIDESLQKAIDQSIRESPLAPNVILPPCAALVHKIPNMSTTTAPTETVGFTSMAPTTEEHVSKAFGKAMKKYHPPGEGGPPRGGGSPGGEGPSGGPPRGGGPPGGGGPPAGGAAAGRQPAAATADIRPNGAPPSIFSGDRALADNFLDELKLYFHLNWAVPSY